VAEITFTRKSLEALAWVAQQDHLKGVHVEHYRDEADVGWIRATITPAARGNWASGRMPEHTFKVSPLGHVYDSAGERVREGGPL